MGRELILLPDYAKKSLLTFGWVDDFEKLDTARWTAIEADTNGAVAIDADGMNGIVQATVTTTDNEEAYLHTLENFKFEDGKPMLAIARLQYAEIATDDANVIFGFIEGWAANALQDNGAGPPDDYDGAVWFKTDGGTKWQVETSVGTSQKTETTEKTAGGSAFHTLAIEVCPIGGGEMEVNYLIDTAGGNALIQPNIDGANPRTPVIKHTKAFSSVAEMGLGFGLKNGGANSETLNVDLVGVFRRR